MKQVKKVVLLEVTGILILLITIGLLITIPRMRQVSHPTLKVSGYVRDARTGQPINGAVISDGQYAGGKKHTFSDASGHFEYVTWPEEHYVVATAYGYQNKEKILRTGHFNHPTNEVISFELDTDNLASAK